MGDVYKGDPIQMDNLGGTSILGNLHIVPYCSILFHIVPLAPLAPLADPPFISDFQMASITATLRLVLVRPEVGRKCLGSKSVSNPINPRRRRYKKGHTYIWWWFCLPPQTFGDESWRKHHVLKTSHALLLLAGASLRLRHAPGSSAGGGRADASAPAMPVWQQSL